MTAQQLAESLLKHAESIAPDACVIVYVSCPKEGSDDEFEDAYDMLRADHWAVAEAIMLLTQHLASDVEDAQESST